MKKILVVDDEAAILDICRHNLERQGYEVITALNALVALEILERDRIDLVLSDFRMPVMDGIAFLHKVKGQWPQLGFIMMTAYWISNHQEIEKFKNLMIAFLRKPFEFSDLISLIEKYFREQEHAEAKP